MSPEPQSVIMLHPNNRNGFSLVELLAAVALISALGLFAAGFMAFSTGSKVVSDYEKTSNDLTSRLAKYYQAVTSLKSDNFNQDSTFDESGTNLIAKPLLDSVMEGFRYEIAVLGTATNSEWNSLAVGGFPLTNPLAVDAEFKASTTAQIPGNGRVRTKPERIRYYLDLDNSRSDLDQVDASEKTFPIFDYVRSYLQANDPCFLGPSGTCSVTQFDNSKPRVDLMQDSHNFEAPRMDLETGTNDIYKKFSYYLASRCVPRTAAALTSAGDGRSTITQGAPWLSSYYVLNMLNRRPFFDTLRVGGGRDSSVRCCPASNPNCTDGSIANYLVRTYVIKIKREDLFSKDIGGSADWTDTEVNVTANEPLMIKAFGQITTDQNGEPVSLQPTGSETTPPTKKFDNTFATAALIGRIGNGAPFLVGASFSTQNANASGRLYLAINDDKDQSTTRYTGKFNTEISTISKKCNEGCPQTISEFPSPAELDPVLETGFMVNINLNLGTYKLKTFKVLNACLFGAGKQCEKFAQNPVAPIPDWYRIIKSGETNGVLQKSLEGGGLIKIGEFK